jgi:hypothetical protein
LPIAESFVRLLKAGDSDGQSSKKKGAPLGALDEVHRVNPPGRALTQKPTFADTVGNS